MAISYRDEAEKEFLECSEVAKSEIKAFHNKRLAEFRQAMMFYVEVCFTWSSTNKFTNK